MAGEFASVVKAEKELVLDEPGVHARHALLQRLVQLNQTIHGHHHYHAIIITVPCNTQLSI